MVEDGLTLAVVGTATRQGTQRRMLCDAVAEHRFPHPTGHPPDVLAVAVVDGTGSSPAVAEAAYLAAEVAARVAARHNTIAGVLAATQLLANPTVPIPAPDGSLVLARLRRGAATIAHVGDCRAYGWTHRRLHPYTVDHTLGQRLRAQGAPDEQAAGHDHQTVNSIARATISTITVTTIDDPLIVLTTDGVHQALTHDQIAAILTDHDDDPGACADALVAAAHAARPQDDATAVAIHRSAQPATDPDRQRARPASSPTHPAPTHTGKEVPLMTDNDPDTADPDATQPVTVDDNDD